MTQRDDQRLIYLTLRGDADAAEALRRRAKRRGDAVMMALGDAVQSAGLDALTMLQDRFDALFDDDPELRALAVEEIAALPIARKLREPPVLAALSDHSPLVQGAALIALATLCTDQAMLSRRLLDAAAQQDLADAAFAAIAHVYGPAQPDDEGHRMFFSQRLSALVEDGYDGPEAFLGGPALPWELRCGAGWLNILDAHAPRPRYIPDHLEWSRNNLIELILTFDPRVITLDESRFLLPHERLSLALALIVMARLISDGELDYSGMWANRALECLGEVSPVTLAALSMAPDRIPGVLLRARALAMRRHLGLLPLDEALRALHSAEHDYRDVALQRCASDADALSPSTLLHILHLARRHLHARTVLERLTDPPVVLIERLLNTSSHDLLAWPPALIALLARALGDAALDRLQTLGLHQGAPLRAHLLQAMAFMIDHADEARHRLTTLTRAEDLNLRAEARQALQRLNASLALHQGA